MARSGESTAGQGLLQVMTEKREMAVGELSRRTGLSTAAINFYIREGLLPPPVKTSATRALYDESYVERIGRIQQLKAQGLTLRLIARVLDNPDPATALGVTRPERPARPRGPVVMQEFERETGLSREQIFSALDLGLLDPVEGHRTERGLRFDARDIAAGRALERLLGWGIGFDLLARHAAEFEPLTRAETHYLAEHLAVVRRTDTSRRAALETSGAFGRIRDYLRARKLAGAYPDWLEGD